MNFISFLQPVFLLSSSQIKAAGVSEARLHALASGEEKLPHTDRLPALPEPVSKE